MALTTTTGDDTGSVVIALVVLVNTTLGVRQELSADRAVRARQTDVVLLSRQGPAGHPERPSNRHEVGRERRLHNGVAAVRPRSWVPGPGPLGT